MKHKRFLALCLGVLFVSPAKSQTPVDMDSRRTEDVCEAALRYFFAHHAAAHAKAICISTTAPLPLSFIDRFADHIPPVVWSVECTSDLWTGIKYMKTKEPAVLIKITSIRWVSGKEAEVKGSSPVGDFVRPPITISVIERNGRWLVKRDKDGGVS